MTDNKALIHIPFHGKCVEILGYRIDGFESFEAFCEHLKKCAEMEDIINRQRAEIEGWKETANQYQNLWCEAEKDVQTVKAEAIKEFAERLVAIYENDKRYDRPHAHTLVMTLFRNIDSLVKEMVGDL